MAAAEPSRVLLMSVIVDLQLTLWALVLLTLDSAARSRDPETGGGQPPLPDGFGSRWPCPEEPTPRPVRDRDSPVHTAQHTRLASSLNSKLSQKRLGKAFPETLLHKGHEIVPHKTFRVFRLRRQKVSRWLTASTIPSARRRAESRRCHPRIGESAVFSFRCDNHACRRTKEGPDQVRRAPWRSGRAPQPRPLGQPYLTEWASIRAPR